MANFRILVTRGETGTCARVKSTQHRSNRAELTHELHKHMHLLGPAPKRCLESLADLGLSDGEIARYLKMPQHVVTDLRSVWGIDIAL